MIARFLDQMKVVDVLLCTGITGGATWLLLTHMTAIRHSAAFVVAVMAAVLVFVRLQHHQHVRKGGER